MGCGSGASSDAAVPAPPAVGATAPAPRPPFHAELGGDVDAGADAAATPEPAVDPAFHARLVKQLRAVVGGAFDSYDWHALLHAKASYGNVKVWVPGTGERLADDTGGRALASVPLGLAAYGAAVPFVDWTAARGSAFWLGTPCAQSMGGAEFAKLDRLSALEVFATAWPDALAIAATLGPRLAGAWLVGHSAGALPAVLAGLIGGAHRIDAYGVPSVVGALDGDDGIVHLHTDPLDPAGAMGSVDASGKAQIDLASAFVVTLKAGGTLSHHDYASWPAPAP